MITLERAIALAAEAHAGQTDRGGNSYILHSLRVMLKQRDTVAMIVAVMHDVLEDCPGWHEARLEAEGFTREMIDALRALTRLPGEEYDAFIRRAAGNGIAREVKRADLLDNLDATRLPQITDADERRMEKYRAALATLET